MTSKAVKTMLNGVKFTDVDLVDEAIVIMERVT